MFVLVTGRVEEKKANYESVKWCLQRCVGGCTTHSHLIIYRDEPYVASCLMCPCSSALVTDVTPHNNANKLSSNAKCLNRWFTAGECQRHELRKQRVAHVGLKWFISHTLKTPISGFLCSLLMWLLSQSLVQTKNVNIISIITQINNAWGRSINIQDRSGTCIEWCLNVVMQRRGRKIHLFLFFSTSTNVWQPQVNV